MFYINYEECKLIIRFTRPLKFNSFILTMRNVNNQQDPTKELTLIRFILTMRNVNLIKSALYLKALSVLY